MYSPGKPASTDAPPPGDGRSGPDSTLLDSTLSDRSYGTDPWSRWMGWRLRLLVVSALLGCVAAVFLASTLANAPRLEAQWRNGAHGRLELAASTDPALQTFTGRALVGVVARDGSRTDLDDVALRRSPRWLVDDAQRARHVAMHQALASALQQGKVTLLFSSGEAVEVQPRPLGLASLSGMFWMLCGLSLVLYLVAMVVLLAWPSLLNLLYALAALSQASNLALIAAESAASLPVLLPSPALNPAVHAVLDLIAGAALVHATMLHPRRLPGAVIISGIAWASAASLVGLLYQGLLPAAWWWVQSGVMMQVLSAIAFLTWSRAIEPHPFAMAMRRFAAVTAFVWIAVTLAVALTVGMPIHQQIAQLGPPLWSVALGALLATLPFLSTSHQVMHEFSWVAAISTIGTALDLLFVTVFSLSQFASLTLALFVSLGLYSAARQWALNRLHNRSVLTTERMFERLYRIARQVEAHPEQMPQLLTSLLRDLFRPMSAEVVDRPHARTRTANNGSTLLIPLPELPPIGLVQGGTIVLRYAHHGQRLFTIEDARLVRRMVEQLRRTVAFDLAVEQGRNEERMRMAQDLHDDIGARLLTLMYKANSPEMEDYVRHTLQDLKTLTRGLATPTHPLSHAAAEWKSDLTQRLAIAHISLDWNFTSDRDLMLSVVQWSALTRVMRELVSNVISHSQAQQVHIEFVLQDDRLELTVSDNGVGARPETWSHGLGLGGVRKRVRQLNGDVTWNERPGGGIACRVRVSRFSDEP